MTDMSTSEMGPDRHAHSTAVSINSAHSDPRSPSIHTASREDSIPMSHPTPDLQAIQGAYAGNVERLEQHAERLSFSSDLAEGLRRLNSQQRRHDTNLPSPLQFSPPERHVRPNTVSGPTVTGHDSVPSNRQDATTGSPLVRDLLGSPIQSSVSLFGMRELPLEKSDMIGTRENKAYPRRNPSAASEYGQLYEVTASSVQRNPSVLSSNTIQQAKDAFAEFDGTHASEIEQQVSTDEVPSRPSGVNFETDRVEFEKPQADLVYYPAPIPVMLSLPPKLSKRLPISKSGDQARRTLVEENVKPAAHDDSTPRLLDDLVNDGEGYNHSASPMAPPRSANFSQGASPSRNLQLLHDSAVKTLDSILDASVNAPVGAFTDHPIVGPSGAEIYRSAGNSKPRHTVTNRKSEMMSLSKQSNEPPSLSIAIPNQDANTPEIQSSHDDEAEGEALLDTAKPTTLLAELETRKKQQQSRNRTAADAFPNGMHATLLQLDSVAQRQRENRKTKHVTLVWESTATADAESLRDEDTPLALLARPQGPDRAAETEESLGLLDRRQLEENEPLSARRARLTGVHVSNGARQSIIHEDANRAGSPSKVGDKVEAEENNETLAQRKRRLRVQSAIPKERGVSGELTSEMLGQFGIPLPQSTTNAQKAPGPHASSEDDEPLAQRRQRLRGMPAVTR